MVTQPFNPLVALTSTARQINEQTNRAAKALGDSVTQTANQLLTGASQVFPPLPGLPGAPVAGQSSHRRANPNGGQLLPTPQQLIPTQALQAFSQIEDVIFPPGLPRPSRVLLQAAGAPARRAPAEEVAPPMVETGAAAAGVEGAQRPAAARRVSRAVGVQAV